MKPGAFGDRYGFFFWLGWIAVFAGAFALAAAGWTAAIGTLFGEIRTKELAVTWAVCVFGSWFLIIIPLMRKKERIWKRLNAGEDEAAGAWLAWMGLFLGLLCAAALGWSWILRERILAEPGLDPVWLKAVAASWLGLTIPFLVLLYRRADTIFREAAKRQNPKPVHRVVPLALERRLLPDTVSRRLRALPDTLRGGHLVTLFLKDGRSVEHVFVHDAREIRGVYDRSSLGFSPEDVVDALPTGADGLLTYEESKWVRFEADSVEG